MATILRRFAVQQDVVEVVVKKLTGDTRKAIDQNIIVKTQEQMRLLEIKARGKLTKLDTKEVRAAILLDYVAREEKLIRLDHKDLMQAVNIGGKSKAKFNQLYEMVGNYRSPETAAVPGKNVSKRTTRGQSTHHRPQEPEQQASSESSIPRLAIRLSSSIPDPHGFAIQAKKLFSDVQDFVHTLELPRRSDQLTDIQRFHLSYEAACLYHVVAKTQTKKLSRMAKQLSKQQAATALNNKAVEEQMNRPLEIEDILKTCPNFSDRDFKEVCKHVETLVTEMEQAKEKAGKKRKAAADASKTRESQNQLKGKRGKKKGRKSADTVSKKKVGDDDNPPKKRHSKGDPSSNKEPRAKKGASRRMVEMDIPSLQEWRKQVLAEVCQTAKKDLVAKGMPPESITKSALLASAADEVLRKFGLA